MISPFLTQRKTARNCRKFLLNLFIKVDNMIIETHLNVIGENIIFQITEPF